MKTAKSIARRKFLRQTVAAGAAVALRPLVARAADATDGPPRKIRVGVIGCGSVSQHYLSHLLNCPFAEVVSVCDIRPERARRAASHFKIAHHYPHIREMLTGTPFELFVNLTDMQEHEGLNRLALESGRHVWSEKPIANSRAGAESLLRLARTRGVRLWGAPTTVQSPQFAFMARTLATGALGRVAAAHASYGHLGPDWAEFFYAEGGGSLPDLGVYNLTTLTGLLGPARAVTALTSIITPKRHITGKGEIAVKAEDNAMLLLDHGNGVLSHVQCGFNYFSAKEHDSTQQANHTLTITGTGGTMALAGYDWAPHGVDLATHRQRRFKRHADAQGDYVWQNGASLAAECLATGRELLCTPEQALHVVEIISAARESQRLGRRVALRSRFRWPLPV